MSCQPLAFCLLLQLWMCKNGIKDSVRMDIMTTCGKVLLFVLLAAMPSALHAQGSVVVADMDSRLPLGGATIITDHNERIVADYRGLCLRPTSFRSASISRKGYLQRRMTAAEMQCDTIFLIPLEVTLSGVVITAPRMSFDSRSIAKNVAKDAALMHPPVGFSPLGLLLTLLPKKHKSSRLEKLKKVLDNY